MNISGFNKNTQIGDYIAVLKRRKWLVISVLFITVSSVTIATFMQTKIYRATATVIVDAESPEVLSVKDVIKLGETNYFAYRDYLETQQEIIRSRRTAYNVIKKLKLGARPEYRGEKDPTEKLLRKLKVELVRDTRILRVSVDDEDPVLASRIANEFAKVYADSNIALKMKALREAGEWLREEVRKQEKRVKSSELKLQLYKEENDIVSIENQKNMINDSLASLNANYLNSKKKRLQVETTYRNIIDKEGEVTFANLPSLISENKSLQQLKDDYLKQEALLTEYVRVYKHKHPKMIKLLENIGYLKSRIKNEIETEYRGSVEEEGKFETALNEQKKKALELDRKVIDYNAIKRELETNERVMQIVLNRFKETSISGQMFTNNIRLQDLAEEPKSPIKPRKTFNIALSFILGVMGGVTLAFLREHMDVTLKDPKEIAALLEMPMLGTVPSVKINKKGLVGAGSERIVEKESHSLIAEAYRLIRTSILFSVNHSNSAKSIVVTSSVPKEGKTFTAANLAIMTANSGEQVLLVDADMRKPRIHKVFDIENETGLSDFLLEKETFDSVIKPSGIENLRIVTAGNIPNNPAELIASKNMRLFLENASFKFSKIIFDTPPVALVTDATLLSSICTGVVLIVEGKKVTRHVLARSKELLQKVDAKLIGVVVNNISLTEDISSFPQYYYGKYYSAA
ncbi:MAG: polysaccharide biosynthesis tyrosine autokinase [Candidatus Omnitrophota bacterium]